MSRLGFLAALGEDLTSKIGLVPSPSFGDAVFRCVFYHVRLFFRFHLRGVPVYRLFRFFQEELAYGRFTSGPVVFVEGLRVLCVSFRGSGLCLWVCPWVRCLWGSPLCIFNFFSILWVRCTVFMVRAWHLVGRGRTVVGLGAYGSGTTFTFLCHSC